MIIYNDNNINHDDNNNIINSNNNINSNKIKYGASNARLLIQIIPNILGSM
jgi:hypothetical protein